MFATVNEAELLQELLDALVAVRVDLKVISDDVSVIDREQQFGVLNFDRGELASVTYHWHDGDEILPAQHPSNCCIASACKMLPENIEHLLRDQQRLDRAIGAIPARLLSILNGLNNGVNWRATIVAECIDKVILWPGVDSWEAPRIRPDIHHVLRMLEKSKPFENWAEMGKNIEKWQAEAYSLRHELQLPLKDDLQTGAVDNAHQEDPRPPKMTWQEAAKRLATLQKQGAGFTSYGTLGGDFGCSASTVHKAIQKTPSLQTWAGGSATPKAQSLVPIITDQVPQQRELRPEDSAAINEYLENAKPEEKEWFTTLSPGDQLAFLDDHDGDINAVDRSTGGKGQIYKRILSRKP